MYTSIFNLKIDELVVDHETVLTAEECMFNEIKFENYISP